jgi:polyisoprenoid-binding protein YceI
MKFQIKLSTAIILIYSFVIYGQTKQYQSVKNESSITYQLTHPLHEIESTSKDSYCVIEADIAKKEIKKVTVQVDVMTFNSGNSNRDSHAMEVIEAIFYPDARFTSSNVYSKGDSLKVQGKLTFHGVTRDVTISTLPKWSGNKLVVSGSFDISLTAFKIERPSLLMIPVKDLLRFTLTQTFNL